MRILMLLCLFGLSGGCGSTVLVQGCDADVALLEPLKFPPKPSPPVTNGDLIHALIDINHDIKLDNQKKSEFISQWEKCQHE